MFVGEFSIAEKVFKNKSFIFFWLDLQSSSCLDLLLAPLVYRRLRSHASQMKSLHRNETGEVWWHSYTTQF